MKPIATDTYSIEKLLNGGYVYVDKTALLRRLVDGGLGTQFFIARPRRFGKSLAVSTLQAIFECRRELFKGLAIDDGGYKWEKFPVIWLDMSTTAAGTVAEFSEKVNGLLRENCVRLGVEPDFGSLPDKNFRALIHAVAAASPAGKVVLLVDEYDKPLLKHIGKEDVEPFRDALKEFYSVIKATEGKQRFTFITGVSKFSKVSIFSDLNNLTDLTMRADMATLFGYTHEEVKANFGEHIAALAEANGMTPEEAFGRIVETYDGYRFHRNAERVVNPVSFGRCLAEREFKYYWYETATPTFLVDLLKKTPLMVSEIAVTEEDLGAYEPTDPALEPLLFQTGYLTIAGTEPLGELTLLKLDYPNKEVRNAFSRSLMSAYTNCRGAQLNR